MERKAATLFSFPLKSVAPTAVSVIVMTYSEPSNSRSIIQGKKNCRLVPLNLAAASRERTRRHRRRVPPDGVVTLWQPHHSPGGGGSADGLGGASGRVISQDLCAQWKGHGFDHRKKKTGSVSINRLHPLAAPRPVETPRSHTESQPRHAWVTAKLSCFFRLRREVGGREGWWRRKTAGKLIANLLMMAYFPGVRYSSVQF